MLALAIFLITLVFVIWQPRGLGIGWSATGGALLALATGVITPHDIPIVWHIVWDATFTFVGLIIISLTLDEAGFFHWAALHVARWGGGSGRRLFPLVILLGALIAAFFANDGAALLLTPIVLAILLRLGFKPAGALAFVIATGFVADTTSLPLIISNLVNIVSANYFAIPFDRYAQVMIPVDLAALAATLVVLWLYFRRDLPERYALDGLEAPAHAIRDPLVFRASFPLLGTLLTAYFVTAQFGVPVSVVTGAGALILLALAGRWHRGGRGGIIPVRKVLKEAPWQIVIFSLGMYLVVYGLRNAGLTAYLARILEWLGGHGPTISALGTGFLSAALSSVMNNMPSVLVGALAIDQSHGLSAASREAMIYANVIGCDLGPKFTPIGSLATLLWLHVLARKGETITWGQYMKVGLIITPPVLIVTLLALAVWLPLVGHS
ncbi:arsenic transporter [Acidihalobacter yilgarnensis]|uniref:Arsenic transporter n=1 Tax=Acidihalobacter yilgarnensis TaxID=2819280 RepID=A0A1D8IS56_9GAMM|nr:arsenic transporter [Acidihalobacter yilgarnensis]AOU99174.1 arsenic transporter [Acidihalobacter yilgarnensis]